MALLLHAEAKGLFLQTIAEAQRLGLAHEGARQNKPSFRAKRKREGRSKSQKNS